MTEELALAIHAEGLGFLASGRVKVNAGKQPPGCDVPCAGARLKDVKGYFGVGWATTDSTGPYHLTRVLMQSNQANSPTVPMVVLLEFLQGAFRSRCVMVCHAVVWRMSGESVDTSRVGRT